MGAMVMRQPAGGGATTSRSMSVWSIVLVLLVIAFWRTMAPERSAKYVRSLIAKQQADAATLERRASMELDELARERRAVSKERQRLEALREQLKALNFSADALEAADGDIAPIGAAYRPPRQQAERFEGDAKEAPEEVEELVDTDEQDDDEEVVVVREKDPAEGCPLVWAPVAAETGLGTQTEHIWAHLTLARALNACVALPPVVARTAAATKYVPAHEVVDVPSLFDIGIRVVPLSSCKFGSGVTTLFGDALQGVAAVRHFTQYVRSADPVLAVTSVLVNNTTPVHQFMPEGDAAAQAAHIRAIVGSGARCVGAGRLKALAETPHDDVVRAYRTAAKVRTYVDDRYASIAPAALFVRLRWRPKVCSEAPTGHACLGDGTTLPLKDYVAAVKYEARRVGAAHLYLSLPPDAPEAAMKYLVDNVRIVDPVVLRLEGDEFAANVVERELALRARAFVHDGGVWGATIQRARLVADPARYEQKADIADVIARWRADGAPSNARFLLPEGKVLKRGKRRVKKPVVEAPVEEAVAEQQVEEAAVEQPAEEADAAADEPPADDQGAAYEPPAEQAPAEEQPEAGVEEQSEAQPEVAVEEQPEEQPEAQPEAAVEEQPEAPVEDVPFDGNAAAGEAVEDANQSLDEAVREESDAEAPADEPQGEAPVEEAASEDEANGEEPLAAADDGGDVAQDEGGNGEEADVNDGGEEGGDEPVRLGDEGR